uniref:MYB55 n=1 Tax=Arundo donax TaxID=35708 RepID=A0A0A9DF35_ARUDO
MYFVLYAWVHMQGCRGVARAAGCGGSTT